MNFDENYRSFLNDFGKGRKAVLSTAENNIVSSRMMSIVQINGIFYFQTDKTFRKYRQLTQNHNVALCIDNIQIEGEAEEIGHPLKNPDFCKAFEECFKGSFDAYTSLENERLFAVKPAYIQRWIYKNGLPYIESFDFRTHTYKFEQYIGI